jgi:hypothetical protein
MLTLADTYFGKRGSGGVSTVSLAETPILLIQYRGGEPSWVPDDQVQEINDFLKEALSVRDVRLPSIQGLPFVEISHSSGGYFYGGRGVGNIWNLGWIEVIGRRQDEGRFFIDLLRRDLQQYAALLQIGYTGLEPNSEWLFFYHILNHQRLE